jgi:glycosyltransferase involved in cell wall biosynthesis
MTRVDVVCPVYREEATILRFHQALAEATKTLGETISFRCIYVVDPGGDRSEELLCDLAKRDPSVAVLVMSRRFGHQAALIAGLDACDGDAVIMLDSDLQHPPSLIPELIERWRAGADIVQAIREDGKETTLHRRMTSDLFYRLVHRFSDIKIRSGAADYRLLSRKVVAIFRDQLREQNPFMRGLVTWVGFEIAYVPFAPQKRLGGTSNYSLSDLVIFAVNGLCSFSKFPLRICVWMGLVIATLSIVGGMANIVLYFLFSSRYAPGWASLFAFTTFTVGINLFFLGVIGEYVGLIFDEVKGRPRYLVRSEFGATARPAAHRNGERSEVNGGVQPGSLRRVPQGVHD